ESIARGLAILPDLLRLRLQHFLVDVHRFAERFEQLFPRLALPNHTFHHPARDLFVAVLFREMLASLPVRPDGTSDDEDEDYDDGSDDENRIHARALDVTGRARRRASAQHSSCRWV